jgi:hypothetical protein
MHLMSATLVNTMWKLLNIKNCLIKFHTNGRANLKRRGVSKNGPNKVPNCQFINNPTGT